MIRSKYERSDIVRLLVVILCRCSKRPD